MTDQPPPLAGMLPKMAGAAPTRRPAPEPPVARTAPPPSVRRPQRAAVVAEPSSSGVETRKYTMPFDDAQHDKATDVERVALRAAGLRKPRGARHEMIHHLIEIADEHPEVMAMLVEKFRLANPS